MHATDRIAGHQGSEEDARRVPAASQQIDAAEQRRLPLGRGVDGDKGNAGDRKTVTDTIAIVPRVE